MKLLSPLLLFTLMTSASLSHGNSGEKPPARTQAEFEAMLEEIANEVPSSCNAILKRMPEIPTSPRFKAVIKEKWMPLIDLIIKDLQSDPNLGVSVTLFEVLPKRILSLSEMDEEVLQVIFELLRGEKALTKKQFINAILIDLPSAGIKGRDLIAAYKIAGRNPKNLLEEVIEGSITGSLLQIGKPKKIVN